MELLNANKDDLSNEMMAVLAVILEMTLSCEMMCYKCADSFDRAGYRKIFFQQKKHALSEARKAIETCIKQLDIAFQSVYDKIYMKVPENFIARADGMQWLAHDMTELVLTYLSRVDHNDDKRDRIKKAIRNFKPADDMFFDLDKLLKYFDIK